MSDKVESFDVDAQLKALGEGLARPMVPCSVCGDDTRDEFFGVPLCDPYNDAGRTVKQCKWIYRERTGG